MLGFQSSVLRLAQYGFSFIRSLNKPYLSSWSYIFFLFTCTIVSLYFQVGRGNCQTLQTESWNVYNQLLQQERRRNWLASELSKILNTPAQPEVWKRLVKKMFPATTREEYLNRNTNSSAYTQSVESKDECENYFIVISYFNFHMVQINATWRVRNFSKLYKRGEIVWKLDYWDPLRIYPMAWYL